MKNFVQTGNMITVPAPAPLTSGQGVQIGALFGVASTTVASGEPVAIDTSGVYELPKEATTDAYAIGDEVEWNAAQHRVAPIDEGTRIGVVVAAAGATAPVVRVKLDG